MGSTGLTHVQFSLHPQIYFWRPILSPQRLVFQDHNFLNVSLSKLSTFPMHLKYVYLQESVIF